MIINTNISKVGQAIIIMIKKGKHLQKLKGKSGLKVKRFMNVKETKIHTIQAYLENENNLNFLLPKDTSFNYNQNAKVLVTIKKFFFDKIEEVSMN